MSDNMKTLKIGDSIYKVESFAPREAIPFGLKVIKVLGPLLSGIVDKGTLEERLKRAIAEAGNVDSAEIEKLMQMAYDRVYTPTNEPLSNEASFNVWFKDHKGELFECGFRAIMMLADDFLPAGLKL